MVIRRSWGPVPGWRRRVIALVGLVILVSLALVGCSAAGPAPPAGGPPAGTQPTASTSSGGASSTATGQHSAATQTSEGGQVTVAVTWQGASAGPVFAVVMDTHAVDLDGYDLRQLAVLRTDQGRELRPTGWDAPKGSHHRQGTLTFPTTTADGQPVIEPATRVVELVVQNIAGVPERTFRWTL